MPGKVFSRLKGWYSKGRSTEFVRLSYTDKRSHEHLFSECSDSNQVCQQKCLAGSKGGTAKEGAQNLLDFHHSNLHELMREIIGFLKCK